MCRDSKNIRAAQYRKILIRYYVRNSFSCRRIQSVKRHFYFDRTMTNPYRDVRFVGVKNHRKNIRFSIINIFSRLNISRCHVFFFLRLVKIPNNKHSCNYDNSAVMIMRLIFFFSKFVAWKKNLNFFFNSIPKTISRLFQGNRWILSRGYV